MNTMTKPVAPEPASGPASAAIAHDDGEGNAWPALQYDAPPTNEYGRLLAVPDAEGAEGGVSGEEGDMTMRDLIHHRIFGRRGQIQSSRAAAFSWKQRAPFPSARNLETIDWPISLSPYQVGRLLHGFQPEVMEDKWFIYADGPDASGQAFIHFHRSWTGQKMAELSIEVMGDVGGEAGPWSGRVRQLTWKKDGQGEEADQGCSEPMAKFVILEICRWVLQVPLLEKCEDPPEWEGLAHRRAISVPVTQTSYRGGNIDQETLEDAQRLLALGKNPEVSID